MALQFITKRFRKSPDYIMVPPQNVKNEDGVTMAMPKEDEKKEDTTLKGKKNNKKNRKEDMIDKDKIQELEAVVKEMQPEVKVVKADRGLIERTESSKIIITEDNRQVLID